MIRHSRAGTVVATLGWAAILFATLRSAPESGVPHSVLCLVCGELGGADVLQNVLLFLPLGVGLGMMRMPVARGLALIVATTAGVELLQATIVGGRFASLGDIFANSAGGAVGMWLGRHDAHWAFPAPRARRILARSSLAAMLLVLIAASASIRLVESSGPLALVVAPVEKHGRRFDGAVLASSLGGEPISPGWLPSAMDVQFLQTGARFSTRVASVPWVEYESTIAGIMDRQHRGLVRVSQDGRDAVLLVFVAGTHSGLRGPRLVLPVALPPREGETVMIEAEVTRPRLVLTVRTGDSIATRSLALGPSTAWIVLFPFAYSSGGVVAIVSLAWLAVLTIPAGYWSGLARARTSQQGAPLEESRVPARELGVNLFCVAIYMIIGLGIAPRVMGLAPPLPLHWLAPLVGFALGVTAARLASRMAG